jgi:nucleoside-diphosphate-sugar epimerase
MKVALIGAGNIGTSGVLPALLQRGHDVTVVSRQERKMDGAQHLSLNYHGSGFAKTIREHDFEALISMITFSERDAKILLEAGGAKTQLIFISTVCVYGGPLSDCPATEYTPLRPITSSGTHKAIAEQWLLRGNPQTTVFRLASTFDPTSPVRRQLSGSSQWIERLKRGKPVVVGENRDTQWSWCTAVDAGVAIAAAVGREKCFGQIYNLTRPDTISWKDYHERVAVAAGLEPNLIFVHPDMIVASKLNHLLYVEQSRWSQSFNISKLQSHIPEFAPTIGFEEAIRPCLEHLETHPARFDPAQEEAEDDLIRTWHNLQYLQASLEAS